MQAAVHAVSAPPPTLKEDLGLVASLSKDHLTAFCGAARELLRAPEDASMFRKAGRQLGVEPAAVEAAIRALCYVMVGATTAGRAPEDLMHGVDIELSDESTAALIDFFRDVAPQLEQVLGASPRSNTHTCTYCLTRLMHLLLRCVGRS